MSEVQRQALARSLAPRIACLGLDEIRLIDHLVARLELGRERYGEMNLAAPRDWSKELGEELVDALVYHAARELAAQDLARAGLREAARLEMLGGSDGFDVRVALGTALADCRTPAGRLETILHAAQTGQITNELARELLDAPEFAPEQHLTRVSTEPARIAATPDASGGDPYEEVLFDEHGLPHTCLVVGNECTVCGRVFGGEAG